MSGILADEVRVRALLVHLRCGQRLLCADGPGQDNSADRLLRLPALQVDVRAFPHRGPAVHARQLALGIRLGKPARVCCAVLLMCVACTVAAVVPCASVPRRQGDARSAAGPLAGQAGRKGTLIAPPASLLPPRTHACVCVVVNACRSTLW